MSKQKTLIILLPLVMGIVGAVIGLAAGMVMWVLYASIDLLWYDLPHVLNIRQFHPLMILTLTILGGLLVGLAQRFLGDYPARMEDAIKTFRETGEFDYKHLPQGLVTSFVSLFFGGSLGPEAAIVGLVGGSATWFSRSIKTVLIQKNLVDLDTPDEPLPPRLKRLASIMGWIGGIAVFSLLAIQIFSGGMLGEFTYHFQGIDLLTALPTGLVGALGGVIYLASNKALSEAMSRGYFGTHPIFRALLGGLGLGIVGAAFPEVLFSGNHDLPLLLSTGHSWYIALLMGISKILMTALLLSAGWKGGQFLPLMYSGAALGLGLSVIFPAISPITGVVGGMTGLTTVVMGSPLLVILIVLLMVQNVKLLGIIMSATLIGYGISRLHSLLQNEVEVPVETTQSEQPLPDLVTSAEEI